MKTRIYSVNVPGPCGYSFAIKGNLSNEGQAIDLACEEELFDDPRDARYAIAEEITGNQQEVDAFRNCTYEC